MRPQDLFQRLLREAAAQAEAMLAQPGQAARLRARGEDGLSDIARLEHSPFVEDQLLALALRLAGGTDAPGPLLPALSEHFRVAPSSFAMEAQRRMVWADADGQGAPIGPAQTAAATLERRLAEAGADLPAARDAYAALYADLWGDPRLGAAASARRLMMAMVAALQARRD